MKLMDRNLVVQRSSLLFNLSHTACKHTRRFALNKHTGDYSPRKPQRLNYVRQLNVHAVPPRHASYTAMHHKPARLTRGGGVLSCSGGRRRRRRPPPPVLLSAGRRLRHVGREAHLLVLLRASPALVRGSVAFAEDHDPEVRLQPAVEAVGDEDDARRHHGDRQQPQAAPRAAAAPRLHRDQRGGPPRADLPLAGFHRTTAATHSFFNDDI
jgi:hypothetical protein